MIEQLSNSPILYGIAGGMIFGGTFGFKAYTEGEEFEFGKLAITVALAGFLGGIFELVGYNPTPEYWFFILFGFVGLVAEVETIIKLIIRGHTDDARDRLDNLGEAAGDGLKHIGEDAGEEEIRDSVVKRLPKNSGIDSETDFDEAYRRALERTEGPVPDEPEDEEEQVVEEGP